MDTDPEYRQHEGQYSHHRGDRRGQSAVAKAIHAISNRANGPFIEVNCAVLHENLIESELFGYEKGSLYRRGLCR